MWGPSGPVYKVFCLWVASFASETSSEKVPRFGGHVPSDYPSIWDIFSLFVGVRLKTSAFSELNNYRYLKLQVAVTQPFEVEVPLQQKRYGGKNITRAVPYG